MDNETGSQPQPAVNDAPEAVSVYTPQPQAQLPPHKKRPKLILLVILLLVVLAGIFSWWYITNNSSSETPNNDPRAVAEQHIHKGNNAVQLQDKLKSYNEAKKILYDLEEYERVITMYRFAEKNVDHNERFYSFIPYYLAETHFLSGDIDSAIAQQSELLALYKKGNYEQPMTQAEAQGRLEYYKKLKSSNEKADFSIKVSDQVVPSE